MAKPKKRTLHAGYCYKEHRLKMTGTEKDSSFSVDCSGNVYDNQDGGRRKVGKMNTKGQIIVKANYLAKHGERLEQIEARIP